MTLKNVLLHGDHVYWYLQRPYDGLLYIGKRKKLFYPYFDRFFYKGLRGVEIVDKEGFFKRLKGKVLFADEDMPKSVWDDFRKKGLLLKKGKKLIWGERMIKKRGELRKMREVARIGGEVLKGLEMIRRGDPISEVYKLLAEPLKEGIMLGEVLVNTETGGYIHSCKGKKVGKFLLVDVCYKKDLYFCDLSITYVYDKKLKAMAENVLNTFYECIDHAQEGKSFEQLKKLVEKRGLKMRHALGHGVGIRIHEPPMKEDKLVKGCTFAMEPGHYDNKVWIRFEDTFVLKKKPRSLSGLYG